MKSVVHNVSSGITHFNLSGYRESLTLDGKSGMMVPDQPLFSVVVLHIFVHIVLFPSRLLPVSSNSNMSNGLTPVDATLDCFPQHSLCTS